MAFLLIAAGLGLAVLLNYSAAMLIAAYLLLNISYSLKLKHQPIIDVFIIAIGFVIRLFVGSIICTIELSMWIVMMTFLLALFLALAKRRDDVLIYIKKEKKTRRSVDGYNLEFLNASMVIMASVTIVSYLMYSVTPEIITKFGSDNIYLTVIFVIFGIIRYLQITMVTQNSGSPTEVLIKDKWIQSSIIGWIIGYYLIIYF